MEKRELTITARTPDFEEPEDADREAYEAEEEDAEVRERIVCDALEGYSEIGDDDLFEETGLDSWDEFEEALCSLAEAGRIVLGLDRDDGHRVVRPVESWL